MNIFFTHEAFGRICNDQKLLIKAYGDRMCRVIRRRLDDLAAAASLHEFKMLPGRCHELKGNRAGQLSLDLVHPQRLIFIPSKSDIHRDDGGIDWNKVDSIEIVGIEDTHE